MMSKFLQKLNKEQRVDYIVSPLLLKLWENQRKESPRGIGGMIFYENNLIIIDDKENLKEKIHETAHYLSNIKDKRYIAWKNDILSSIRTDKSYDKIINDLYQIGYTTESAEEELAAYICQEYKPEDLKRLHPLFADLIDDKVYFNTEEYVVSSCLEKLEIWFDIHRIKELFLTKEGCRIFQEIQI